jgi:hypothetical protein
VDTVERVRRVLSPRGDVTEKRIIGGGFGFMAGGHLCCGVSVRGLTVRLGPGGKAEALQLPYVKPLKVGQREASGFVVVDLEAVSSDDALREWIERGLRFVATL